MNALKLTLFVLAATLAGAAASSAQTAAAPREQMQDSARVRVIDDFLADSRRYLGL